MFEKSPCIFLYSHTQAQGSFSDDEGDESGSEDSDDEESDEDDVKVPETNGQNAVGAAQSHLSVKDFPDNVCAGSLLTLEITKRNDLVQQAVLRLGNDPIKCVDDCAKLSGKIFCVNGWWFCIILICVLTGLRSACTKVSKLLTASQLLTSHCHSGEESCCTRI